MKNKLHTLLLLAFVAIISKPSFAQTTLQFGAEDPTELVKAPLIHWDYLRTLSPEWVRELRNTPTAPWEPLNRLFNEKDADGRFTLLQYQVWSLGTNDWVDDNKNTYYYTLDANGRVSEMEVSVVNQFYTNENTMYFEYNASGDMTKVSYENSGGNIYHERHFSYNPQGLRTVDSAFSVQAGNLVHSGLTHYEYDGNNKCIKSTSVYNFNPNWDTTGYTLYTWQGNQVASIEAHSINWPTPEIIPFNRFEYTYTNGKPAEVTVYFYDTADQQFEPVSFYRHYYTNNLMTAMVSGDDIGSGLQNTDSIAFTYLANGNLDTGYQFAPVGNGWETAARFRLLFKRINTGIIQLVPTVNAVNVYPNPVADYLSVDVEMGKEGNISLQVVDITGKLVKTINAVNLPAGKNTLKVSAQDMAPGVYFIGVENKTVKIIKQ